MVLVRCPIAELARLIGSPGPDGAITETAKDGATCSRQRYGGQPRHLSRDNAVDCVPSPRLPHKLLAPGPERSIGTHRQGVLTASTERPHFCQSGNLRGVGVAGGYPITELPVGVTSKGPDGPPVVHHQRVVSSCRDGGDRGQAQHLRRRGTPDPVPPVPSPSSPEVLLPQVQMLPSPRTAMEWKLPAAMAVTLPSPDTGTGLLGVTSDPSPS